MDAAMKLVMLRGLANLFGAAGDTKTSTSLNRVADGLEAGVNVDTHMRNVAQAMKSGKPRDWEEAHSRISSDHKLLHTNDPIAPPETEATPKATDNQRAAAEDRVENRQGVATDKRRTSGGGAGD